MSSLVEGSYTSISKEIGKAFKTVWGHQSVFLKMALVPLLFLAMTSTAGMIHESHFRYVIDTQQFKMTIKEAIYFVCLSVFGGLLVPPFLRYILTGVPEKNSFLPYARQWKNILKMALWLVPVGVIVSSAWMVIYISSLILLPLIFMGKEFLTSNSVFLTSIILASIISIFLGASCSLIFPAIANKEPAGPILLLRSIRRLWGNVLRLIVITLIVLAGIICLILIADAMWTFVFKTLIQLHYEKISQTVGLFVWGYFIAYFCACLCWISARFYWLGIHKDAKN